MRIIATIGVICLTAYLYPLGFGGAPDAPYTLGIALAQLLFVMFAFVAIVLLSRSMERDVFWPWHWWIRRAAPPFAGRERRCGRQRRHGLGVPPAAERRREGADRRAAEG